MKLLGETAAAGLRVRPFDLIADVPAMSALFCQLGYETDEGVLRSRVVVGVRDSLHNRLGERQSEAIAGAHCVI